MKKLVSCAAVVMLFAVSAVVADMGGPMGCKCDKGEMGEMHGMSGHGDKGMMMMNMMMAMQKDLNLSKDQMRSMWKIHMDAAKEMIRNEADLKALKIDLMSAMHQDTPDFTTARKVTKQISDIMAMQKMSKIDMMEKGYAVLNADQKSKLPEMMMKMMKHMHGDGDDEDNE